MWYRYLDNFRRGISVFAIFSYGIAVLGNPPPPPPPPPNVPLQCYAVNDSRHINHMWFN